MKTWTFGLVAVTLLSLAQIAHTWAADSATDPRGRFEGVSASENTVWVIDTRTGRVRKCTQEFADQTPRCTGLSN